MSDDPLDTLASLPAGPYSDQDRYADFRAVFMGTEQGRRVLREILSWGRMFKSAAVGVPVDPYAMAMREGERNIALRLLATVHHEPRGKPAQTTKRPERQA